MENRIAVERRKFNEVVQTYNTYIRRFPNNMLSGMFGFEKKAYFASDEKAKDAPDIKF
jgi:LemA protein